MYIIQYDQVLIPLNVFIMANFVRLLFSDCYFLSDRYFQIVIFFVRSLSHLMNTQGQNPDASSDGDFMSEAKDWAGELISGQTGTGRILVSSLSNNLINKQKHIYRYV